MIKKNKSVKNFAMRKINLIFQEILNPDEVHFFRLEDIESLVEAVKDAVKNDTSEMAYAHYLKDYTLEHFTKSYLQIYRNLLA